MAELFGVKVPAVSKHLKKIFEEGELDEKVGISKMEISSPHGAIPDKTQTSEAMFYIRQSQRRIMLIVIVPSLSLIGQNQGEYELFVHHSNLALKNILSAYGYSVRIVLLILFLYIIHPQGKKLPYWTVAGINGVLYFTSPLAKLFFEIRESDFASLWGPLGLSVY